MRKSTSGFTIVELLIVIVIIAVLAAITILAYNGIRVRANTSAVVSDLQSASKKLLLYKIDNGNYPAGASGGAVRAALNTIDMKLSTDAYSTASNTNILYLTESTGTQFALLARPNGSSTTYYITEVLKTPVEYGGSGSSAYPGGGTAAIATYLGIASPINTYGYNANATPPGFQFWTP